ncbi:hypothetical protein JCM6882_006303 [Rhodosporidiobolus microsporus]
MRLVEALAPLPPPSSSSKHNSQGPSTLADSTFIPPNSRRAARPLKAVSSSSSDSLPSSRDARTEYTPPVPGNALDILQSSPPSTSTLTLAPTRSSASSSTRRSYQAAPPVPHPHFMFQTQQSYPRRPKTADSQTTNASKSSLGRAFARAFGMSSSSSLKSETPSSQPTRPASVPQPAVQDATRRMNALDLAKEKSRRAVAFVKRKLNSKTPVEQLPQTWADYEKAYANYEVDIEDPPLPPQRIAREGAEPTPFQKRLYVAPYPPNEALRQNVVNRLDLFGTKERAAMNASQATLDITASPPLPTSVAMIPSASAASTATSRSSYIAPSEGLSSRRNSTSGFSTHSASTDATSAAVHAGASTDAVASLKDHPVFRALVARAKDVFQARVSAITVLDEDTQLYLASGGMPDGIETTPRAASFCSHAILNEDRGMVVMNSTEDWRFANNLVTTHLGARFYAGVPVMARAGPNDPSVPIGTLCIIDDKPREEFTEAHRRVLRDFAMQASNAIETWVAERMATKMARLHTLMPFPCLAPPAPLSPPLTPPPSAGLAPPRPPRRPHTASGPPTSALPSTPPASLHRFGSVSTSTGGHSRKGSDAESTASSANIVQPRRPTALSLGVTTDDPVSALPREIQKQFDTAVRMLAKALELELVYLAALDLALLDSSASNGTKLRILSSHGLPTPPPSFDPALHLKALRAPEGGLIYKNPRYAASATASYAAGILIPVLEVRRTGYVLCGYTRKEGRDFQQRDLTYMVRFAEGLEQAAIRASKISAAIAISPAAAAAAATTA